MELQRHASILIRQSNVLLQLTGSNDAGAHNDQAIHEQIAEMHNRLDALAGLLAPDSHEPTHEAYQVVTPLLQGDVHQLPTSTTQFTDALARFLSDQTDVTGLNVSNLRLQARGLKMHYERIDGQLAMLER